MALCSAIFKRSLIVILTVAMSVCCCEVRQFLSPDAAPDASVAGCCCCNDHVCPTDDESTSPLPMQGCQCRIKGWTSSAQPTIEFDDDAAPSCCLVVTDQATVVAVQIAAGVEDTAARPPGPGDRSLLRQRCALIV